MKNVNGKTQFVHTDEEEEEENPEDQDEHGNLRGLIDDGVEREEDGDEDEEDADKGDGEGESDSGEEIGHRKRKRSKWFLRPWPHPTSVVE